MSGKRQANAMMYGVEFQIYAGIYLMLKAFDSFSELKIEGEDEDIEIIKDDDSTQYAQAKSSFNPYDTTNKLASKKIRSAIESFADITNLTDKDEYIYITNINGNPFGIQHEMFSGSYYYRFEELPPKPKNKLVEIATDKGIDPAKIIVVGFPFYGNDHDTRLKTVKEQLDGIIAKINPILTPYANELLSLWSSQFLSNGTIKRGNITKDNIATDLVYFVLKGNDISDKTADNLDIKIEDLIEANDLYTGLINRKSLSFNEYNSLITMYYTYQKRNENPGLFDFITKNHQRIAKLFNLDANAALTSTLKTVCAKLIAYKILSRRSSLETIYNSLRSNT